MNLFNIFKKKNVIEYSEVKEKEKYTIPDINLLVLADVHRGLSEEEQSVIEKYRSLVDVIITLGDIPVEGLKQIDADFGVLGNHDYWGQLGDKDLHGKSVEVNGVYFAGFQGSSRYKGGPFILYSQEDSIEEAVKIPKADILITHDRRFDSSLMSAQDNAHCGLEGINKYIEFNNPFLQIHGHHHKNVRNKYKDTEIIGVYKCSLIKIKDSEIFVEVLF